jgi:phosphodiesterase/alkaline phosphatase D-like protein
MKKLLGFMFVMTLCSFALAQQGASRVATKQQSSPGAEQQITNGPVAEYVSDSTCKLGWTSREAGTMTVQYGPERGQMSATAQATDGRDGKNHHVELTGLKPNTRYFFQVIRDGQPVGGVGTFRTVGAGDPPEQSKAVIPQ